MRPEADGFDVDYTEGMVKKNKRFGPNFLQQKNSAQA
jgi:hypothetical protein